MSIPSRPEVQQMQDSQNTHGFFPFSDPPLRNIPYVSQAQAQTQNLHPTLPPSPTEERNRIHNHNHNAFPDPTPASATPSYHQSPDPIFRIQTNHHHPTQATTNGASSPSRQDEMPHSTRDNSFEPRGGNEGMGAGIRIRIRIPIPIQMPAPTPTPTPPPTALPPFPSRALQTTNARTPRTARFLPPSRIFVLLVVALIFICASTIFWPIDWSEMYATVTRG
ncbi:hypothetical protein DSL72_008244 [Monilinia vaccinii-corymbosi]|uniref:Uncharacterized protein n=1 Tax=Monilinia vaccinii-corymbosi TaxID=61207 RepID=A0A8A3PK72_9HELO|nr:hypothetical protein DSL72_008244 [Monilinia vaccinii-corymbosi]